MNYIFRADDIKRMIEHWLATPPNGYVGVSYGRNPKELLNRPMDDDTADTLLPQARELRGNGMVDLRLRSLHHTHQKKTPH